MSREIQKFKVTEWRSLREADGEPDVSQEFIRARYGMHYLRGNQLPHFSITADIAERASPYNRHEERAVGAGLPAGIWRIVGGGCCHEDIERAFPSLSPLVRWHLCDAKGVPMHYLANAKYWLKKHLGVFRVFPHSEPESRKPGEPEPLEAFKHTVIFGALPEDEGELARVLATKAPEPGTIPELAEDPRERAAGFILACANYWLLRRLPALRRTFQAELERFQVEMIEPREYLDSTNKEQAAGLSASSSVYLLLSPRGANPSGSP